MYKFTTTSGTVYAVRDGRITRTGDTIYGSPDDAVIVDQPFTFAPNTSMPLAIGQRVKVMFRTDVPGIGAWIITSPVVSIDRTVNPDLAHVKAVSNLLAAFHG